MTDNRTTELLPCPFCSSEPDLLESYGGWYIRCSCGVSMCENYSEGGFPVGEFVTEAEAIAAWNTRTDYHGYEQAAIEAWKSIKAWNTRATHGTLTAEKVRETVEKHWHDLPNEYDMPEATALPEYSYNWQAIADELNAELGSGTCTMSIGKSRIGDDEIESFVCSICGYETFRQYTFGNDGEFVSYPEPNYCPHCGALRSWAND